MTDYPRVDPDGPRRRDAATALREWLGDTNLPRDLMDRIARAREERRATDAEAAYRAETFEDSRARAADALRRHLRGESIADHYDNDDDAA